MALTATIHTFDIELADGLLSAVSFISSPLASSVTGWIKGWMRSFAWDCDLAALVGLLGTPLTMAGRPAFRWRAR